jgi:hypothetical protein
VTISSKLFALYPAFHALAILGCLYQFVLSPNPLRFASIFLAIYLLPLASFRLLNLITPIREGTSDIMGNKFSPWWAGHQIQGLLMAVTWFESPMRMVPGLYSLWLRLWGSKIGKNVYWTPGISVYDRNLLDVGDGALFGEKCNTVSHVISPKGGKGLLYIKKVTVGARAFIGAGSTLSPGTIVEPGVLLRADSKIYPNSLVTKEGITRTKMDEEEVSSP